MIDVRETQLGLVSKLSRPLLGLRTAVLLGAHSEAGFSFGWVPC